MENKGIYANFDTEVITETEDDRNLYKVNVKFRNAQAGSPVDELARLADEHGLLKPLILSEDIKYMAQNANTKNNIYPNIDLSEDDPKDWDYTFNIEKNNFYTYYAGKDKVNDRDKIVSVLENEKDGKIIIDKDTIEHSIQKKIAIYDKKGDRHYDTISAFIKSMRGSDIDASLFYLAKMLESGEDIKFIARRMIIFAAEDISNADPNALILATSTFDAINTVGMPEARIILAQTVTYLAAAIKSNSTYLAIDKALDFVRTNQDKTVPNKLKDSHYAGSKNLITEEYLYPHDHGGYVDTNYLPDDFAGEKFYQAKYLGYEKEMIERLEKIKEGKNED